MSLHQRLLAEIERREAIAKAATGGPWTIRISSTGIRSAGQPYAFIIRPDGGYVVERHNYGTVEDLRHIILHDPADALRRYAHYRRVLERHEALPDPVDTPRGPYVVCRLCSDLDGDLIRVVGYPCWETLDVAGALGVAVDGAS